MGQQSHVSVAALTRLVGSVAVSAAAVLSALTGAAGVSAAAVLSELTGAAVVFAAAMLSDLTGVLLHLRLAHQAHQLFQPQVSQSVPVAVDHQLLAHGCRHNACKRRSA